MFQDSPVMGLWKSLGLLTDVSGLSHCIPGRILFLCRFKFDVVMWLDMACKTVISGWKTLGLSGPFHIPVSFAIATRNFLMVQFPSACITEDDPS